MGSSYPPVFSHLNDLHVAFDESSVAGEGLDVEQNLLSGRHEVLRQRRPHVEAVDLAERRRTAACKGQRRLYSRSSEHDTPFQQSRGDYPTLKN